MKAAGIGENRALPVLEFIQFSSLRDNIRARPQMDVKRVIQDDLHADVFQLVRQHLAPQRWQAFGLLNLERTQHFAQQFMRGDDRVTFRVWALVVLGAWLEQHMDQLDLSA